MKQQDILPPPGLAAFLSEAEVSAREQDMPVDRLLRKALDYYLFRLHLQKTQAYGRRKAEELGITEDDVQRLIDEYRREQRDVSLH